MVNLKDPLYHDFFVIINPSIELKHLLELHQDYYANVIDRNYEDVDIQNIADIYDGIKYKEFVASLSEDERKSYVSVTFNSDGSPIFKSSNFSIWPIQISPNELPPSIRSKRPLTFSLWFGHDKPNMNIFLNPFVENINELSRKGIQCTMNNEVKHIKVYAICCCVDSVARAPMQGLIQFNGYYGCNWCLHPGRLVRHDRGAAIKYPLLLEIPIRRTEETTLQYIQESLQTDTVVYGVKKATPLLKLRHFNIVDGFVPDAMHCIALGVVKQFLDYWFQPSNNTYRISKASIRQINRHLKSLRVPTQIARLSRLITERSFWKSRELENWLMYYSLPILEQVQEFEKYRKHWALLVNAFHLLMQNNVTIDDIVRADIFLKQFVAETQLLYSEDAMTFNVHQLLHISQSVADWGPLWAHSSYPFESGNGQIVKSVHAAKGVINQICRNFSVKQSLQIMEQHISRKEESTVIDYCCYLENRCTKEITKIGNNRYLGRGANVQMEYIQNLNLSANNTQIFRKLIKDNCVFKSCRKSLLRSDNSFVKTENNEYIQIVDFIVDTENNLEYTLCKKLEIENFPSRFNMFVKKVVTILNEISVIETRQLQKLCVHMNIDNKQYICAVPHMYWYS